MSIVLPSPLHVLLQSNRFVKLLSAVIFLLSVNILAIICFICKFCVYFDCAKILY
jgi:hypothetical protein